VSIRKSKLIRSQGEAGCSHIDRGYPPGTLVLPITFHEDVGSYIRSSKTPVSSPLWSVVIFCLRQLALG